MQTKRSSKADSVRISRVRPPDYTGNDLLQYWRNTGALVPIGCYDSLGGRYFTDSGMSGHEGHLRVLADRVANNGFDLTEIGINLECSNGQYDLVGISGGPEKREILCFEVKCTSKANDRAARQLRRFRRNMLGVGVRLFRYTGESDSLVECNEQGYEMKPRPGTGEALP